MFDCNGIQVLDIHYCEDIWRLLNQEWWNGFKWGFIIPMVAIWVVIIYFKIYFKYKKD